MKRYQCTMNGCGQLFARRQYFIRHLERKHCLLDLRNGNALLAELIAAAHCANVDDGFENDHSMADGLQDKTLTGMVLARTVKEGTAIDEHL
ncbi:hypothetical protein AAVH_10462 [Aphelenchoides avenae]|nr:hypothetical protein AAVH_10462 [Aphelenchus avenae]